MLVNRFETVFADTAAARDLHYAVRYRVFCEEAGFEDPSQFPDHREQDEFDGQAAHFMIWDRLEREWVGGSRFVSATSPSMPCEGVCGTPLLHLDERRTRAAEFSRLCVLSKLRRTEREVRFGMLSPDGQTSAQDTPAFFRQEEHEIFLRLLWAGFAWAKSHDVDYFYCLVHRALARLLGRFGMDLHVVGAPVQHRGTRVPHCYEVHSAEAGMRVALPEFVSRVDDAGPYVPYSQFIGRMPTPAGADANVYDFATIRSAAAVGESRASVMIDRVA
jgi:N-acyl amino acid synthase of PEP-CTERM/exosortase system